MTRRPAILALAALACGVPAGPAARAQEAPVALPMPAGFALSPATAAVEEEWQLVVTTPDPDADGPQVMTYMSPSQGTAGARS